MFKILVIVGLLYIIFLMETSFEDKPVTQVIGAVVEMDSSYLIGEYVGGLGYWDGEDFVDTIPCIEWSEIEISNFMVYPYPVTFVGPVYFEDSVTFKDTVCFDVEPMYYEGCIGGYATLEIR